MRPGVCCGQVTSLAPLSTHADPDNAKSICRQSALAGEEAIRGAFLCLIDGRFSRQADTLPLSLAAFV